MSWIRIIASLLLGAAFIQGSAGQAAAGLEWCAVDPVVHVLGAQFHLKTNVALTPSAIGSVDYVLVVPSNAQGTVSVAIPTGQTTQTVEVRYTGAAYSGSGSFSVSATVAVTAAEKADVQLAVSGPSVTNATYDSTTNKRLSVQFDVSAR